MRKGGRLYPRCKCEHGRGYHIDGACSGSASCKCKRYEPKRSLRFRKSDPSKRRFAKMRNVEYAAWIREQPCVAGEKDGGQSCAWWGPMPKGRTLFPCEAAHVRSRGAGGADEGNIVPLCYEHHRKQHAIGIRSFEVAFDVDLKATAAALLVKYERDVMGAPVP